MEAEAILLGKWKNFEELEESVCLEELQEIIKAGRERDHRLMKFQAAINGINLDEEEDAAERFDAIKRRVEAKLSGKSEEELEFAELGIDIA
jgi:hypothetical protein